MRRDIQIRITQNDRKEYTRLVNNAKAKIRRTSQNYGVDISGEIRLPTIDSFKTREEYNEWKSEQRKFTNRSNTKLQFRKNEFGVVASVSEINKVIADTKKAQRLAKKMIKDAEKLPFISGGKQQGTVGQQMKQMSKPNVGGVVPPPNFNFSKIKSRSRFEDIKVNVENRADKEKLEKRKEQAKQNFIELLALSLNSDADELIEKLSNVPADVFHEMYLMFDEFDFDMWDSEGLLRGHDEAMQHVSQMLSYVERYERGKLNMDMKGF